MRRLLRASLLVALAAAGPARALCPQTPCAPPGGYKSGFPKQLAGTVTAGHGIPHGQPVMADLGLTPGHKSIVLGTYGGKLWVVNWDGSVPTGFPLQLPADVASTPAVADLDGDGKPDIIIPCKTGLYIFYNQGYTARKAGTNYLPDRASYPSHRDWDTPRPPRTN